MAVAYRNYAAYYTAPENDPFREDYSRVLSSFEPESTRTPVELLELVLTSTTIPQVFVTAAQNSAGETRIYLLHRPQRITAPLGGTRPSGCPAPSLRGG